MNVRLLGPVTAATLNVNGRSYVGTPGAVYDIVDGQDAETLGASGWTRVCLSGPTSSRPTISMANNPNYAARPGLHFLDTTIGALIIFDGQNWRSPATGSIV
jgi:hypothetical protein